MSKNLKKPVTFFILSFFIILLFLVFLGKLYFTKKEEKETLPREEVTPEREIEEKLKELPPLPSEISPEKIEEDLKRLEKLKLPSVEGTQEGNLSPEEIEKQLKNL